MIQASVSKNINAQADKLWETIRQFDGVDKYVPVITSCRVEGSGVGAKRFCTMQDGAKLSEELLSLDEQNRILTYSVNSDDMPVENYTGKVEITELGNNDCKIEWSSTFNVKGAPEQEVKTMIESVLGMALDGLEAMHTGDNSA